MRKLNVFDCELEEEEGNGTIAHRGVTLGTQLGASRIGASLYEVARDRWVWPYHYHHGAEEWLYVVDGAPVLRDLRGERILRPGDFVCFPSGYEGAHTVGGPGRFVMFSVGGWPKPSVVAYPDSDKVATLAGDSGVRGLDTLNFRRSDAVDYWYGEGSDAPVRAVEPVRAPADGRPLPACNALELETDPSDMEQPDGFQRRVRRLGKLLGAERLAATICEIDPGQGGAPYHCEHGREEWLLVVSGTPTLRHPDGEDVLAPGDLVCLPDGRAGARRLLNRSDAPARAIFLSTDEVPSVREYLDKRWMLVRYSREHDALEFPLHDFHYWEAGLV